MPTLYQRIQRFVRSDEGPTAVEYAVVVCLVAIRTIGTNSKTAFTNVANSIGS
jgi:pilus assembly protein Flp/PilA